MRRPDRILTSAAAAVLLWAAAACGGPDAAGRGQAGGGTAAPRGDLLGGPRGVVRMSVRGIMDQPVEGLMVQLISHETAIRTTVYTGELGAFEFPVLPSGDYVLRIPRPLHFHAYQRDSVRIEGPTVLPEIRVERRSDTEFLPPDEDLLDQLTGAEWLFNIEGSHHLKRTLVNSCSTGCHGSERVFRRTFDARSWRLILHRMSNYSQRILVNSSGRDRTQLTENAEMLADWLARVRGLDSEVPPIVPFDRPKGLATRAVVTEYELPWALVNIHDVSGDTDGNIWFNINRSPFIGKLDPTTGEVTQYRLPAPRYPPTTIRRTGSTGPSWSAVPPSPSSSRAIRTTRSGSIRARTGSSSTRTPGASGSRRPGRGTSGCWTPRPARCATSSPADRATTPFLPTASRSGEPTRGGSSGGTRGP